MAVRSTKPCKMMLPKEGVDMAKWAVVACDQYTSEPEYWKEVNEFVGDAPSTVRITLPEIYLEGDDVAERTEKINAEMIRYEKEGILQELPSGMILLDRETGRVCGRKGLMMAFDLEEYDYHLGSTSLIRPTEKTVEERIPPRLAVRKNASMELPHIMLLIDDPDRTVIEPIYEKRNEFKKVYDVELMQKGGHLTGWFIPEGDVTDKIQDALDKLADRATFNKKYNLEKDYPIVQYATGDGNHSMATAKANWERIKEGLSEEEKMTHPARFVLAEVVNIHDESLEIEAIYRVLFGADPADVVEAAKAFFEKNGGSVEEGEVAGAQVFKWTAGKKKGVFSVKNSKWAMEVATLQNFLDDYLSTRKNIKIDYIHGLDSLAQLSEQDGNMGFYLPDPAKADLFRGVIIDGVLPRKTFSMGEAQEKRFYMEARKIVK
ncbi:Uncharacterized conserved protein, DUF1015 family [Lachnospiraceae bacterium XBB1006]|nr:Uncharacterized conserved protein, DUF1015 family [Lachnospiraceae bacterium XBB1006]